MNRLLILAYDFPPYVSVGGLRPFAWYKYLKEYGVEPIVVTRQWENKYGSELDYIAPSESSDTIVEKTDCGTIIRTPYKPNLANRIMLKYGNTKFVLLRKLVSAFYEFAQFLFFVGPKSGLYSGAKKYLKDNHVDAILATGEPFILFKYASALSKRHNTPWIADYRDPWVQNANRSQFMGRWNAFFERRFMANAAAMTTVSDFFKKKIGENIPLPTTYIIPNGYNPDAIRAVENIKQSDDCLRFAFVGTIYNWHPLESVLRCFSEFSKNPIAPKFELNFYGVNNAEEVGKLVNVKFANLKSHVSIYGRIPNNELLKTLAKHNVMLLFNYYSFMGTKIYDYVGLKRQILFCYSDDADALKLKKRYYPLDELSGISNHLQEDLIRETNSGVIVKDSSQLPSVLNDLYAEFQQNGFITCNSQNIEQYSRRHGAKMLADIVKNLA